VGPVPYDDAEHDQPQRHRGHEQRGQAAADVLFGQPDQAVASGEEQQPDQRGAAELAPRHPVRRRPPAQKKGHPEDQSGRDEPEPGADQRREGLDGDLDAEVRRAPDDVHDGERQPDLDVTTVPSHGS
jgi:hypothetical protein